MMGIFVLMVLLALGVIVNTRAGFIKEADIAINDDSDRAAVSAVVLTVITLIFLAWAVSVVYTPVAFYLGVVFALITLCDSYKGFDQYVKAKEAGHEVWHKKISLLSRLADYGQAVFLLYLLIMVGQNL